MHSCPRRPPGLLACDAEPSLCTQAVTCTRSFSSLAVAPGHSRAETMSTAMAPSNNCCTRAGARRTALAWPWLRVSLHTSNQWMLLRALASYRRGSCTRTLLRCECMCASTACVRVMQSTIAHTVYPYDAIMDRTRTGREHSVRDEVVSGVCDSAAAVQRGWGERGDGGCVGAC